MKEKKMKSRILVCVDKQTLEQFDKSIKPTMVPRSTYIRKMMEDKVKELNNKTY
jgi:metal-responsive CopG/Arc/MetJ family transcriptional regulator